MGELGLLVLFANAANRHHPDSVRKLFPTQHLFSGGSFGRPNDISGTIGLTFDSTLGSPYSDEKCSNNLQRNLLGLRVAKQVR